MNEANVRIERGGRSLGDPARANQQPAEGGYILNRGTLEGGDR
jgi:hypothetical protein